MNVQAALSMALPVLTAAVAWSVWRCGAGYLFPAFLVFSALSCVTQCLFAAHFYNAYLFSSVLLTPLKVLVSWEAMAMRFRYVQDGTPPRTRGERYWLIVLASGVALVMISIGSLLPVQFNVPQLFGKIRVLSELGIAAVLGVAWLYASLRPAKSPRRAKAHLILLFAWFAAVTPNLFAVGRGEDQLWQWISIGGMTAKSWILAGWTWTYRPTRNAVLQGDPQSPKYAQDAGCYRGAGGPAST